MQQIREQFAVRQEDNPNLGEHFSVFMPITGPNGMTRMVKTNWTYHWDEAKGTYRSMPHMSSAFIKEPKKK